MEWILLVVAVGAIITMLGSAFRRGTEAVVTTVASAAVMAGLAFTDQQWVVHVGMAILLLSSTEFLYRPFYKVRSELLGALGSLTAVTVAGLLVGIFPWAIFPLGALLGVWLASGGPARNRRKHVRAEQRAAMKQASAARTVAHTSGNDLKRLFNDPRLSGATRDNLHSLLRRADALHLELRSRQASDRLVFEVEQIHQDFAPTAVRSYLALSPSVADTEPIQDGKTGAVLLDEQLALLHKALDDIAAESHTRGSEDIKASHRFLQDKFGSRGDELTL